MPGIVLEKLEFTQV